MASDLSGRSLGKYQLYNRLGGGGMGEVYRAFQSGMDRVVAIKVLRPMLSDDLFVQRFQREARSAGSLRHPHIIQVFDFGVEDGIYYMAMEYIAGTTLQRHLQVHGALSLDETLRIGSQIADALDYAHNRNIIHRDIKPANVMFIDETARDIVLTDFGLARIKDDTGLTTSGTFLGTPSYISPEAAQGHPLDGRTDMYGLGVILYEMLTGALPFNADTPTAVIIKHIMSPIPSPRDLRADLPIEVEQMVKRTLAKNPDERYPSTGALKTVLDDLRRAIPDDLRTTTPPQGGYRADLPTMTGDPLIIPPTRAAAQTPTSTTRPSSDETLSEQTLSVTPTGVTPKDSPVPPNPMATTPPAAETDPNRRTAQPQIQERRPPQTGIILAIGIVFGVIIMIGLFAVIRQNTTDSLTSVPTALVTEQTEPTAAIQAETAVPTEDGENSWSMLEAAATSVVHAATDVASAAQTALSEAAKALATTVAAPTQTQAATRTEAPTDAPTEVPRQIPSEMPIQVPTNLAPGTSNSQTAVRSLDVIARAEPGELLILFATEEETLGEDGLRGLQTVQVSLRENTNVRFEAVRLPITNAETVEAASERTNAGLIIWIERNGAMETIHFTPSIDVSDLDPFPDVQAHPILYPFAFTFRAEADNRADVVPFMLRMAAGLAKLRFNDWTDGIEHLEEARIAADELERAPANGNPLASLDYALGFSYFQAGDHLTAIGALDRVLQGSRQLEPPYAGYAEYFRALSEYFTGNLQNAVDRLTAMNLAELPTHFAGYGNYFLGASYNDLGEYEAALTALETARTYIPEEPFVYYTRAIAFAALDDLSSAIAELTGAIVFDPDFADAYSLRGIYYEQQGLSALAIGDYREYERITGQLEDWMQALIDAESGE